MSNDFFRTGMGHKFYEGTMPSIVRELKRLNDILEKLVELASKGEKSNEQDQHRD